MRTCSVELCAPGLKTGALRTRGLLAAEDTDGTKGVAARLAASEGDALELVGEVPNLEPSDGTNSAAEL